MVRRMFLPFYSKERGPPRIRMQLCGVKGGRFYRVIVANTRDPARGKHMEVLGSVVPEKKNGIEELRMRFTRLKFWLAVGCEFTPMTERVLGVSGLIPPPPPQYGRRSQGLYTALSEMASARQMGRLKELAEYHKEGAYSYSSEREVEDEDGNTKMVKERTHQFLR
uniref:Ribosomal protein S16 n=1 Tax=Chromera velia CCMP2878 TaxID=1169474 RepID=A0A0G4GAT4_9ALVE|mmetsp:Transcript_11149/g.21548  ORF Transcript_11149/g.21548 Transcript_11149/m.21548 type:complete len:166 (+) Transcript_11149:272-769(+)|eukprot:Cvel_21052.t1-p1 / transcript=Cvel_21052.t1 / gene=Cvel_21052 / organism=Chromera_velia_CCMP2878 / gene_product=30S ribosomal protein S16, putative / transcript_product=30S ribosomal protein S16, putative / location=Cvel_scaffold1944:10540-13166(-) / protein_length=165 / sequence_SO=supercontig / SO=protein_coding / is_pseudo=false